MYPSQEADPDHGTRVVIEHANIRACLKRGYFFSLAQFQHFRLHVLLYSHIDFGLYARSRFQHGGAAWSPPSLGGVACLPLLLRGAAFLLHLWVGLLSPLSFCCVLLPSFSSFGWRYFSLVFFLGAARHRLKGENEKKKKKISTHKISKRRENRKKSFKKDLCRKQGLTPVIGRKKRKKKKKKKRKKERKKE